MGFGIEDFENTDTLGIRLRLLPHGLTPYQRRRILPYIGCESALCVHDAVFDTPGGA